MKVQMGNNKSKISSVGLQKKLIGYFRVLEILIGYFWVHPNVVQFLYIIVSDDISLFLYHKETGHLDRGSELLLGEWKVKVWIGNNKSIIISSFDLQKNPLY